MYNNDKIVDAITKQVGFEDSDQYLIAQSLQASQSGIQYNQVHPLVKYPNLEASLPYIPDTSYPLFSETETYKKYKVVRQYEKLYQAKSDIQPGVFNAAQWEQTSHLSAELSKIERSAAAEVVNALMVNKHISGRGKSLWEDVKLYDGVGSLSNTIAKEGRFVGFEIDLANMRDMAIRLHAVGLQLSQPNPTLNIYIYHTSKTEPLYVLPLTDVGAGMFSWHTPATEVLLPFAAEYGYGGSFIIGYRESELVGAAISKTDYEFGKVPCRTCSTYNVRAHSQWSRHLAINPFSVPETYITGNQLWDMAQNRYNYKTNFGINLSLGVECDITDTVVKNAHLFSEAQALAVAEKILRIFVNNTNNNADAEKMRQLADYELNNKENQTKGLLARKDAVMKSLDFSTSGISPFCLPAAAALVRKGAM